MITHLEVTGSDADKLMGFYGGVFGWQLDANNPAHYGIGMLGNDVSVGVGPAQEGPGAAVFYMAVGDVEGSLAKAEELGGKRIMGPMDVPDGPTIGLFSDPEGHMVGVFEPTG
jgi:predicted enzyme related to lactoylglutathione lyase